LAGRLSRFPDAIIIPLIPCLLQLVTSLFLVAVAVVAEWHGQRQPQRSLGNNASVLVFQKSTLTRLCLYIGICFFRMYILYWLFNRMEDTWSFAEISSPCWYAQYLQPPPSTMTTMTTTAVDCVRQRAFDFSDHVVLYYGQILPIVTAEVFYLTTTVQHDHARSPASSSAGSTATMMTMMMTMTMMIRTLLLVGFLLYLYAVVGRAAYGTAAYFHTGAEVYGGYLVSLLVSLPLAHWQCCCRSEFARFPLGVTTTTTTTASGQSRRSS
jgi:hypothetical protein